MKYYAAQVKTRSEEKCIKLFLSLHPQINIKLYFPKREILEKRKGKTERSLLSVFPGYIFIELQDEQNIFDYHWFMRKTPFFYHFLESNSDIKKIGGRDLEIVLHFIKKNTALAKISKVYFNENDRIVVVSGALSGLEGCIVKIDKRKGRAKVMLDLCGEKFSVDLSFEHIETDQSVIKK